MRKPLECGETLKRGAGEGNDECGRRRITRLAVGSSSNRSESTGIGSGAIEEREKQIRARHDVRRRNRRVGGRLHKRNDSVEWYTRMQAFRSITIYYRGEYWGRARNSARTLALFFSEDVFMSAFQQTKVDLAGVGTFGYVEAGSPMRPKSRPKTPKEDLGKRGLNAVRGSGRT